MFSSKPNKPTASASSAAKTKSAWLQGSGSSSSAPTAGSSSSTYPYKSATASTSKSVWNAPSSIGASSSSGITPKSAWNPTATTANTSNKYSSATSATSGRAAISAWSPSTKSSTVAKPTSNSRSLSATNSLSSLSKDTASKPTTSYGQSTVSASASKSSSTSSAWSSSSKSTTSAHQQHSSSSSTRFPSGVLSKTTTARKQETTTAHEQHYASSINKNVMDKATNLSFYKSPDLLAMRSPGGGAAATRGGLAALAGSKYYAPVYGRNRAGEYSMMPAVRTGAAGGGAGVGGLLSVGPAAALATTVLHHANENSATAAAAGESRLMPPIVVAPAKTATSSSAVLPPAVTKSTEPSTNSATATMSNPGQPVQQRMSNKSLRDQPGYLIIFNMEKFKVPGVELRRGSQKDEQALCRTLYEFGFNPTVKRNLKLKELDKAARDLHAKDFKKYACCVVVILSHGHQNETIYAADGAFKLQTMLVDRVAMNETLQGKAKIFIVATCKGSSTEVLGGAGVGRMLLTDATPFAEPTAKALPYMRDTLKCFSTYEGFVSWRDPDRGTVFVQELCRVLEAHGRTMHLEDVLKLVNVALTERATNQQVPTVMSTMSFNICLGDLKH